MSFIQRPIAIRHLGITRRRFGSILAGASLGALIRPRAVADTPPFTVVIVPDPQYLAIPGEVACNTYVRMIQWAIDNRNLVIDGAPLNIKGFIQVGDCQNVARALVANDQEAAAVSAWAIPTTQNMFVAWCCGNHDYEDPSNRALIGHAWRSDTAGAWSPDNLAAKYGSGLDLGNGDNAVWGGVYQDSQFPLSSINNYIRLQIGGRKILVIALEFYPRSAVLNWAAGLQAQYNDHETWVTTHGFMDTFGNRCAHKSLYGPHTYKLADAPDSNSGTQLWSGSDPTWTGLTAWPRLSLVACGHWVDGYKEGWVWQRRQETGAGGQTTQQIFCNGQTADDIDPCDGSTPSPLADIAHLMLLRVWPTTCEAFMVSTNSGLWTGQKGVRDSPTPVQLFSTSFALQSQAPPVQISISGVTNSASGEPVIESGSWVSIYGQNLSATTRPWAEADFIGNAMPTTLDGVSVTIDGNPAVVAYVSPGQINVQAPADATLGQVTVQVSNSYGNATAAATYQATAPALFSFPGGYVAAVHLDGAYVAPVDYFGANATSRPAQPGETIMIFGTGFGPTSTPQPDGRLFTNPLPLQDPSQLQVSIGGVAANVEWAGLCAPGLYQLNVMVPQTATGDQAVSAVLSGVSAQPPLAVAVQTLAL